MKTLVIIKFTRVLQTQNTIIIKLTSASVLLAFIEDITIHWQKNHSFAKEYDLLVC